MFKFIIIFCVIAIVLLCWVGSLYGEEEMTDGSLKLDLSENMATFRYSWDTEVTASVPVSDYYKCLEVCCCDYEECKLACYTLIK